MKNKKLLILITILILTIAGFFISQRAVLFMWTNPWTETSGMGKLAPIITRLNKILEETRLSSHQDGFDYKYIFLNPYGSGFLRNNPIPNDLDMEIGIDLGEYTYDGKNGEEIAQNIMKKINSFRYNFNFTSHEHAKKSGLFIEKDPFAELAGIEKSEEKDTESIAKSLDNVINEKNYIKYVPKIFEKNKKVYKVDYPYAMSSNEILLTGYPMVVIYSDVLAYSKNTQIYPREISIIPEFYFDLKYEDKVIRTEVVPENFFGARLHLKRRYFASSVFSNWYSEIFLRKYPLLTNNDMYYFYRILSYKRHLMEIENIEVTGFNKPSKIFKRIMQTADMLRPVIDKETYQNIENLVIKNLNKPEMQWLNEYDNICAILNSMQRAPGIIMTFNNNNKMQEMYDVGQKAIDELEKSENINKKTIAKLKEFQNTRFKNLLNAKEESETVLVKDDRTYENIREVLRQEMYEQIKDDIPEIEQYAKLFNDVLIKTGHHKAHFYWLNDHTMGILEDDFTKNIKDIDKFVKENGLTEFDYKIIKKSQIPQITLKYDIWVRNNPTEEEERNYKQFKDALMKDKKNNRIKHKVVFDFS